MGLGGEGLMGWNGKGILFTSFSLSFTGTCIF